MAGQPPVKLVLRTGENTNQVLAHKIIDADLYNGEITSFKRFSENNNQNEIFLVTVKRSDPFTGEIRTREAIFKPRVPGDIDGWARTPMEYVAYDLNQKLGMDFVPPTAYRKGLNLQIDGKTFTEGSFTFKAPDYNPMSKLPNAAFSTSHEAIISDHRILCVLMQNADGHYKNLGLGKHWVDGVDRPVFLDWNASLRHDANVTMTNYTATGNTSIVTQVHKTTYDALKKLKSEDFKSLVDVNFITSTEVKEILSRRNAILQYFDALSIKAVSKGRPATDIFFKE